MRGCCFSRRLAFNCALWSQSSTQIRLPPDYYTCFCSLRFKESKESHSRVDCLCKDNTEPFPRIPICCEASATPQVQGVYSSSARSATSQARGLYSSKARSALLKCKEYSSSVRSPLRCEESTPLQVGHCSTFLFLCEGRMEKV